MNWFSALQNRALNSVLTIIFQKKGYRHKDQDFKELLEKEKSVDLRFVPHLKDQNNFWSISAYTASNAINARDRYKRYRFVICH